MIVSFSVGNFRSFSSEETLSLVASKRLSGSHEDHALAIPDSKEQALRAAVMYGANGAGKSNLFKALRFVKQLATRTRARNTGTGREACRLGPTVEEPSTFDLQFVADDKFYRYGFKANDDRITEEWLARLVGEQEKTLYERTTDAADRVTIDVPGPPNQTFLATAAANLEASSLGDDLSAVVRWFNASLVLIAPDENIEPVGHLLSKDTEFLAFAGTFLNAASTGVDHLVVDKAEISEEDLVKMLPKTFVTKLLENIRDDEDGVAVIQLGGSRELLIERKDAQRVYRISIQAAHKIGGQDPVRMDLSEESDGTRRLLQLLPALHVASKESRVYVIDEIDRSMHPLLVWKFLQFFVRSSNNCKSQVIVTTHEANLLDLELLRRDEIWFVEKDTSSSSRLYSLMDFKVRKDLEIRKHYLQGRFGAVPFLGSLDRLIDTKPAP